MGKRNTDKPDLLKPMSDGEMLLIGETHPTISESGWVVRVGRVEVGVRDSEMGARVRCKGKLWEQRHDWPGGPATGRVTGRISTILVHKAIFEKKEDRVHEVVGYEEGEEVSSTNDYSEDPVQDDAEIGRLADDIATGKVKGHWVASRPDSMVEYVPSGWAFEFVIELSP